MEYIQKQKLFEEFLAIWGEKFAEAQGIVKKLAGIDDFVRNLTNYRDVESDEGDLPEPIKLITADFFQSQLEWVSLVAQFDYKIESSFFKDYWMPIEVAGYNYFIDLSTEDIHLFIAEYFCKGPTTWYQGTIIKNLANFNEDFEDYEYWDDYFLHIGNIIGEESSKLQKEHLKLGMAGLIKIRQLKITDITKNLYDCRCVYLPDKLIIYGALPTAIRLLPNDCKISIQSFADTFNRALYSPDQQFTIKGFWFALSNNGCLQTDSISIEFPDYPLMKAYYRYKKLVIDYPTVEIKNYVQKEFDQLFKPDSDLIEDHRIN